MSVGVFPSRIDQGSLVADELGAGALLRWVEAWPECYREGFFTGRRWGATLTRSAGGAKVALYARELGGTDFVSANFYRLSAGAAVRPCEMPMAQIRRFVLEFIPDAAGVNPESAILGPETAQSPDQA